MSNLRRDDQKYFPPNTVILHMDFSTNVKRFGSQFVTSNESRNPKEFGLESFVVYFTSCVSAADPLKFQMRVISMIDDDSKHDTHSDNQS